MSRVAKKPVLLPKGVELVVENECLNIKGPMGQLRQHINKLVKVSRDAENPDLVVFSEAANHPDAWAHAGTARALLNNMVQGVTTGFSKASELVGVGYRVQVSGKVLTLSLGYSQPVEYVLPEGVTAEAPSNTSLIIKGIDKQLVGQVSAEIRSLRPPEPYKGKGIRYVGEVIARKEAKKK